MGYYNECSMDDPNAEIVSDEGWHIDDRRSVSAPAILPTDTFISLALEELVQETQTLLDAALGQKPADKEEITFWRRQRNAFVKAQTYYLQGVRLTATPSGYTVPSASRPGALIHRCWRVGGVWVCSCEAGDKGIFHWHTALICAVERGGELEQLAEDTAEMRLHEGMAAALAEQDREEATLAADILADAAAERAEQAMDRAAMGRRLCEARGRLMDVYAV